MRYDSDIVVIDLEATAEARGRFKMNEANIIEIGAVRLDRRTLDVVDTFSELIRPRDYPITPFITELTGITDEMLAEKDTFDGAIKRFIEWYGPRNHAVLASYGVYYDIPLLRTECARFHITFKEHWVGGAIDVRTAALLWLADHHEPTDGLTIERALKLMELDHLGLTFHRALDDAKAGAAILQKVHLGEASV